MTNKATLDRIPDRVPIGTVFVWKNKVWRRGKGIIYAAHPCKDPMIQEGWIRRERKRWIRRSKIEVTLV